MDKNKKTLSIIAPAYNEELVLDEFYSRVKSVAEGTGLDVEIVYVNDGSTDKTLDVMNRQRAKDDLITIINLSRNFGKEIALTAGLDHAKGAAIVIIDVDLQDPPELINKMVDEWKNGYEIVTAKRIRREGESFFKKITSFLFYRVLNKFSDIHIPNDTGDFRLMDRKAVDALLKLREKHRYMKGLFAWVGFTQKEVLYNREKRLSGKTKWNFFGLLNLAIDGITSFSVLPLRMASLAGIVTAIISLFFGVFIIFKKIIIGDPVSGYPSLVVIITFIGGIQLLALGIIGEYLGRVFNETKNRPLYIVKDVHQSGDGNEHSTENQNNS